MNPKAWNWSWILWQVMAPLFGPIAVSILAVLAWQSGNPQFAINWDLMVDLTPWALTVYAMTLIGATVNDLWPKISTHPALGGSLMTIALMACCYDAMMVIWRHNTPFTSGIPVWIVTSFFVAITIPCCHHASKI